MNQQQFESQRLAAEIIISTVNSLAQSLSQNDNVILENKISEKATSKLSREFIDILKHLQGETETSGGADPSAQLRKINEIISSVIATVEGSIKSTGEEVVRLEATQAGMQRALAAVRDTGESMLRSLTKIDELAEDPPPEKIRKIGDRPEGISNRRNAAALKKSRESEDT